MLQTWLSRSSEAKFSHHNAMHCHLVCVRACVRACVSMAKLAALRVLSQGALTTLAGYLQLLVT